MTRIPLIGGAIAIAAALASAAPASAQIVLEANGARADGRWGGELGAGYGFGAAGFRLTPMVGALVDRGDDDTVKPYGRIEATYAIPLVATVGAGIRAGDDLRPYGTVALPLLPAISLKGNAGPHYFALGLRLGL